jgi:FAD/FMN-containing dehydrogenase
VIVLRAELALVPIVKARTMLVLGYPDIAAAADAVLRIVEHDPIALEGLDDRLVGFEKRKHHNPKALDLLPEDAGWPLVQLGGDTTQEADRRARELLEALGSKTEHEPTVRFFDDPSTNAQSGRSAKEGSGRPDRRRPPCPQRNSADQRRIAVVLPLDWSHCPPGR